MFWFFFSFRRIEFDFRITRLSISDFSLQFSTASDEFISVFRCRIAGCHFNPAVTCSERDICDILDAVFRKCQLERAARLNQTAHGVDFRIAVEKKIAGVVNYRTVVVILDTLNSVSMACNNCICTEIDQQMCDFSRRLIWIFDVVQTPVSRNDYDIRFFMCCLYFFFEGIRPEFRLVNWQIPAARFIFISRVKFHRGINGENCDCKITCSDVNRFRCVLEIFAGTY